jgi:hypothetical protein
MRVFENRVLRRICGPKGDEVTGGWRELHDEEIHNLYSSPSIIRMITSRGMKFTGHVARMGENRNAYMILMGEPEEKRPPGRPRRRWVDNNKMDVRETGRGGLDWICLALEGCCEHDAEPSGSVKCWEVLEWLSNWRLLSMELVRISDWKVSQSKLSISGWLHMSKDDANVERNP